MRRLWLVSIFLGCVGCAQTDSDRASHWRVWVEDGKSDEPQVITDTPHRRLLGGYFETLRTICDWNVCEKGSGGTLEERTPFLPSNLTVTRIGRWDVYDVFDVSNHQAKHKSIVLKDKSGQHRILYTQFAESTAEVADLPEIFAAQEQRILAYRTRIPGTGNFYIEYYFVYDKRNDRPRRVDVFAPIQKEISRLIPKGYRVRKGDGLDLKNKTYSSFVWKKTDGNSQPTGGRIAMSVSIEKGTLHIAEAKYTPRPDRNK